MKLNVRFILIGFCVCMVTSSMLFAQFGKFGKKFEKFKIPGQEEKQETSLQKMPEMPTPNETPSVSPGAGGRKAVNGVCGVSMHIPENWTISQNENNVFSVISSGGSGVGLSLNMNDYGQGFPTEASLNAYRESSEKEKQEGKIITSQNRAISGVIGVERVESPAESPDDPRRITWVGYKGSIGINLVAHARSKDFDANYNLLNQIIESIRFE